MARSILVGNKGLILPSFGARRGNISGARGLLVVGRGRGSAIFTRPISGCLGAVPTRCITHFVIGQRCHG